MIDSALSHAAPVLEVRGLTKRFPGVIANDHITLTLHKGQVLGLLGENGAGKSTLMNMIYGLYAPDEGEIRVGGVPVSIHSASDAIRLGIGMVHQHFQLVPVLTVTDNIMLGNESTRAGLLRFLDRRSARKRILALAQQYGLDVNPDARVQDLSVGAQQRVEILKALYRQADILILDEPTAVLTPQETEGLFRIIEALVARGTSIIFISHKLKEVQRICDQVVVLRGGKVVGEADPKQATREDLARMMVGRPVMLVVDKAPATPGEPVLVVDELRAADDRGLPALRSLSFAVRQGEILGVAGVQGNGQTELIEVLTGLRPAQGGRVLLDGANVTHATPRAVTETGVSHVPEDRHKHGMVASFSVADNMRLQNYYRRPLALGLLTNEPMVAKNAARLMDEYDVRAPGAWVLMSNLSGGNQQKAVIAREFTRPSRLLLVAQPTRGVDVGSIEFIHQQIVAMRDAGTAVLLISTELDEILALSDRIAVMVAGRISAVVDAATADRATLGLLMAGVAHDDAMTAPVPPPPTPELA